MANNPYVNKVEYAGQTVIDISGDTVTPSDVLDGVTFHDRSGTPQTGSVIAHNVYDGLDSMSTSDALSANQGRVLNDKITNLPNTLYSSYNVLIDTVQISQIETVYTLYGSRKFSNYSVLYITPMVEGYFRPGCVIPRSSFAGNGNGTSFTYPSGGINVEVVIKYLSDTQVKMKYNASSARDVRIYLGALKLEY